MLDVDNNWANNGQNMLNKSSDRLENRKTSKSKKKKASKAS